MAVWESFGFCVGERFWGLVELASAEQNGS